MVEEENNLVFVLIGEILLQWIFLSFLKNKTITFVLAYIYMKMVILR